MPSDESSEGQSYWLRGVTMDDKRLLAQKKLSELMGFDTRHSYHHRVLWDFHLGWAHKKHDWTSLAAARTIANELRQRNPSGKVMSLRHISEGNRDLVSWGYLFELEKGSGRRGSRYAINWALLDQAAAGAFPPSVSLGGNATDETPFVSHVGNTTVSLGETLRPRSVPHVGNKDLPTRTGLQTGLRVGSTSDAPHHGDGLAATPDGGAARFDRLFAAYGLKLGSAAAEAEFDRLAPGAELLEQMVVAAKRWRDAYEARGTASQYRKRLATWLRSKCWRDDGPDSMPAKKRPAQRGDVITVVGAPYHFGKQELPAFRYVGADGREREHVFSPDIDAGAIEAMQAVMPDDPDDWGGVKLVLTSDARGKRVFQRAAPD